MVYLVNFKIGVEIDVYSSRNLDCEDGNAYATAFWKSHRSCYPKLAVIARRVYSIPALQNKSE